MSAATAPAAPDACSLAGQIQALLAAPAVTPTRLTRPRRGSQRQHVLDALPAGESSAVDLGALRARLAIVRPADINLTAILSVLIARGLAKRARAGYRQTRYYR